MARTAAAERRQQRQEELRDQLKGCAFIANLASIAEDMVAVSEAMDVAVSRKKTLSKKDKETLFATNIQIEALRFKMETLKARADLDFRRLKFVLPELRSVELTDPNGKNPLGALADALRDAVSGSST